MQIIGITGTLGAGKGTIVSYLVSTYGFTHYSVREFLIQQIRDKGLPVNRDTMTQTANELRAAHGPEYIAEVLFDLASASGKSCIIESIRTTGEVNALKGKGGFTLFSVDADRRIRYDRIVLRGSETDRISYETFAANEERELTSTDPNKQNLSACMQLADFHFTNNGSFDDLYQQVDQVLRSIHPQQS